MNLWHDISAVVAGLFAALAILTVCSIGAALLISFGRQAWKELRRAWHKHWEARAAGHLNRQAVRGIRNGKFGI